jgi:hypothetical protein
MVRCAPHQHAPPEEARDESHGGPVAADLGGWLRLTGHLSLTATAAAEAKDLDGIAVLEGKKATL